MSEDHPFAEYDSATGAGAVGIANGVRRLSLGQGLSSSYTYVFGGNMQCRHGVANAEGSAFAGTSGEAVDRERREEKGMLQGLSCQVVLRAPSDGMLAEFTACLSRWLALTLKWLEWDPPGSSGGAHTSNGLTAATSSIPPSSQLPCLVVAGGGASEVSLSILFRDIALQFVDLNGSRATNGGGYGSSSYNDAGEACYHREPRTGQGEEQKTSTPRRDANKHLPFVSPKQREGDCYDNPALEGFYGGGTARTPSVVSTDTAREDVRHGSRDGAANNRSGDRSVSLAFSVLAKAVAVVPTTIIGNFTVACAHPPGFTGCQDRCRNTTTGSGKLRPVFLLRRALDQLHAVEGRSSTGIILKKGSRANHFGIAFSPSTDVELETPIGLRVETPLVSFSCGLEAGVMHPLAVKYGSLVALVDAMMTLLRVGGVARCRGRLGGAVIGNERTRERDDGGEESDSDSLEDGDDY